MPAPDPKKLYKVQTTRFYKKIVILFSVAVVLLFIAVLYFSLSKTEITLVLIEPERSATFELYVEPLEDDANQPVDTIYGHTIQTTLEETKTITNSSEGSLVDDIATGTVTIYNNWSDDQPLQATTRLLSPEGVLFRIRERVDVPAGGSVENVEVYADQPGVSGDIEATRFTIPGLWEGLQDKIYAESTEPMTGGQVEKKTVTQKQVTKEFSLLTDALLNQIPDAPADLDESLISEDRPYFKTIRIDDSTTIADPAVGEVADTFDLTVTIEVTVVYADAAQLLEYGYAELESALEDNERIADYNTETLPFEIVQHNEEAGRSEIRASLTAAVAPEDDHPVFSKENVAGKTKSEAEQYYEALEFIQDATIVLSPFWVTDIPDNPSQITISVQ